MAQDYEMMELDMFNTLRVAACAALMLAPSAMAQTDGADVDAALAAAREAIDAPGFSGSVVVMQNGETLLSESRGYADQASGRANTSDTRFNIASVGKFLTAVGFVRAADQVDVDDFAALRPAEILVDDAAMFAPDLTVRNLMAHGTDIESFYMSEDGEARSLAARDNADIFELVRSAQDGPIGRRLDGLAYNNSNAIVTGQMMGQMTGRRYEDAMQALVFEPAGIRSAAFTRLSQADALDIALPYVPEGFNVEEMRRPRPGDVMPTSYPQRVDTPINEVISMAAGGLYMTTPDLAQIGMETLDGALLSRDQLTAMCTSQVPMPGMIFGLGCGGRSFGENQVRWGHNGGAPGVSAQLAIYPHQGVVIAVLSNHNGRATPVLNAFEGALFVSEDDVQTQGGYVIRN
jgi:D-alanyl-D-alanine carboxypeptidase